LVILI